MPKSTRKSTKAKPSRRKAPAQKRKSTKRKQPTRARPPQKRKSAARKQSRRATPTRKPKSAKTKQLASTGPTLKRKSVARDEPYRTASTQKRRNTKTKPVPLTTLVLKRLPPELEAATEAAIAKRLAGKPSERSRTLQLRRAVEAVKAIALARMGSEAPTAADLKVADVTVGDIRQAVEKWTKRNLLAASTISMRLKMLRWLGIDCGELLHRHPPKKVRRDIGIDAAATGLIATRLAGTRGEKTRTAQAWLAVDGLRAIVHARRLKESAQSRPPRLSRLAEKAEDFCFEASDVTAADVEALVSRWSERDGLSRGTIRHRLTILGLLGIEVRGKAPRERRTLKWWLHPEKAESLLRHLRAEPAPFLNAAITADYIEWASLVGMRVEESLRLTWADVSLAFKTTEGGELASRSELTVPGLKTEGSQASIALALRPALLLQRRFESRDNAEPRVFPITYKQLLFAWQRCREFVGAKGEKLATLRALRRTAARHLTVNGMPLDILRGYLRHGNVQTTMGYLRLVGGYSTEEQRRWL